LKELEKLALVNNLVTD